MKFKEEAKGQVTILPYFHQKGSWYVFLTTRSCRPMQIKYPKKVASIDEYMCAKQ